MPFTAWKHTERNRQRDRKMYSIKVSQQPQNSVEGPIRFEVQPQGRKV